MSSYWPVRTDQIKAIKKAEAIIPEIKIKTKRTDIYSFYLNPNLEAFQLTLKEVKSTTDILDKGIRIAAKTGVRFPLTAKLIPTML